MRSVITHFVLCIFLWNCKSDSMSIKGPALTRYDPCGLGVIHFDKVSENFWRGVANFELYPYLVEAKISLIFKNEVRIHGGSQNASIVVGDDWHRVVLLVKGNIPKHYKFYVSVQNSTLNSSGVPEVTQFSLNDVILCNKDIKASQTVDSYNVTENDVSDYRHVCGRRTLGNTELTSFRTEAKPGDWPWHVALFVRDEDSDEDDYRCGGNIISRVAVVTAGHCVVIANSTIEPHGLVLVAGISNRNDINQAGRQELIAQKIIVHPSYTYMQATSDLAIIKVHKWKYTDFVQPICIWGPVYNKDQLFGLQATVVGFGRTELNLDSDVLRSTYTMIQNDSTCIAYDSQLYTPLLNDFTFCAGYGPTSGINPRNGDSGGGLVVTTMQPDHRISWFLRGILSKCGVAPGHTECDPEYYVIYVDVGPHYGWLYHNSGLKFSSNVLM